MRNKLSADANPALAQREWQWKESKGIHQEYAYTGIQFY